MADLIAEVHRRIERVAAGAAEVAGLDVSLAMDFREVDRTPMRGLNETIWKGVRVRHSPMPVPRSRFLPPPERAGASFESNIVDWKPGVSQVVNAAGYYCVT